MITEVKPERRERTPNRTLEIHIYDHDSDIALCGYRCPPNARELPWHHGIHDCPRCWEIHNA